MSCRAKRRTVWYEFTMTVEVPEGTTADEASEAVIDAVDLAILRDRGSAEAVLIDATSPDQVRLRDA